MCASHSSTALGHKGEVFPLWPRWELLQFLCGFLKSSVKSLKWERWYKRLQLAVRLTALLFKAARAAKDIKDFAYSQEHEHEKVHFQEEPEGVTVSIYHWLFTLL